MLKRVLLMVLFIAIIPSPALAVKRGGGGKGATGAMHVQVREVIVRTAPEYLSGQAGQLSYGDPVNVTGESGNWSQIASPSGWVPKSAITSHKVSVNADAKFAKSGFKGDEVALAGKGFNPQVEAEYKKNNADLARAYVAVDTIENYGATDAELKAFSSAGKLNK